MNKDLQLLLAALVFLVFGLGLILLVHFTTKKRKYIKKYGIETDGEIINYRAFYNHGSETEMGRSTTSYHITCNYITKNNKEITKEFLDISYRKHFTLKHPIGSKIKIIYLPEAEEQSIVKDNSLDFGLFFIKLTGFGLIGLFALFIYYWIIK